MASRKNKDGGAFMILLCCILAVPTAAFLLDGITTADMTEGLMAGALLGLFHVVLRPLLRIVTAPIGCITLGLFGFAIDVGLLYASAYFIDGFVINNPWHAMLAALLVNGMCAIVGRRN